jgi:hypothetical protein
MRWVPLFFATRFSVPVDPTQAGDVLTHADEMIIGRGQIPKDIGPTRRTYGPRWVQFFFFHPFLYTTRTSVWISDGRLHYELVHPLILLPPLLVLLLWPEGSSGLVVVAALLVWAFYSAFLFFVHRELLLRILKKQEQDRPSSTSPETV